MNVVVDHLQTEYRTNPLGIDVAVPRLTWGFAEGSALCAQTAYQIIVSTDVHALARGLGEQWDSGTVESRQNVQIAYAGLPLRSGTRYFWSVRVWNERGEMSAYSEPAWWEMGLLTPGDWSASWIQAARGSAGDEMCPQFRRVFELERPVVRARLAICGLGQYELYVNGQCIGEHILEPGWTNYHAVCLYKTYDVTTQLRTGENVLGVLLGNGMYRVTASERYTKFTGSFGELKLIARLEVLLSDGSIVRIGSDGQWRSSASPLTFSSIYGGEDYDARREQEGWSEPGFRENEQWQPVEITVGSVLRAQQNPSPRIIETFVPQRWTCLESGSYLADFGQNFSGWVRISVRGPAGARVKITPSELLRDGMVDQSEIGSPFSFQYTLRGSGLETWRPRFTYYGFRYVLVEGAAPVEFARNTGQDVPVLETITGEMLSADVSTTGEFDCSDDLLNRIHRLILMAIRSNIQNLLTDCPHREKLGWLEEVYLMGPSISNNYGIETLYTLMIENMSDAQWENGLVPDIAPEYARFEGGFLDSPEWGSAIILTPWLMYQRYRDRRILDQHYTAMQRYLVYLSSRADGHILDFGLGDWCDIGPNRPYASQTPIALTATAFYFYDAAILAKISNVLGKTEQARQYEQLAERIKDAFNQRFFNREKRNYATGSQAANAIPLVFGLVERSVRQDVLEQIVRDVQDRGYHTTAGDIGYRFVLQALQEYGRSDLIFALAQRREHPSYGFQLAQGATTLTEMWDGPVSGSSQNHLMLGHIEEWFYSGLAGLRVDFTSEPALTIKPAIVPGLNWVKAVLTLPEGRFASAWQAIEPGRIRLSLTVPANQRARLYLPFIEPSTLIWQEDSDVVLVDGLSAVWELPAGTYELEASLLSQS
ncbi:MAG: family 78 glycoside hydrolase catalytic domain [Ktedonobacteraceae bacterium]|nr:family 78 glycoside hydrolase catalytic domain [Ktedonobacteraceae bacterium]